MKRKLLIGVFVLLTFCAYLFTVSQLESNQQGAKVERKVISPTQKGKKKTSEERAVYNEARDLHEY